MSLPPTFLSLTRADYLRIREEEERRRNFVEFLRYTGLQKTMIEAHPELPGHVIFPCHPDMMPYLCRTLVDDFECVEGKTLLVHAPPVPPRRKTRFGVLRVKDLRAVLDGLPEDTPVVVAGGPDHSYRKVGTASLALADFADAGQTFAEWHGPEYANEEGRPVAVVLIGG